MGNVVQSDLSGLKLFLNELDKGEAKARANRAEARQIENDRFTKDVTLGQMGLMLDGSGKVVQATGEHNVYLNAKMHNKFLFAQNEAKINDFQATSGQKRKLDLMTSSTGQEIRDISGENERIRRQIAREESSKDATSKVVTTAENLTSPSGKIIQESEVTQKGKVAEATSLGGAIGSLKAEASTTGQLVAKQRNQAFIDRFNAETPLVLDREMKRMALQRGISDSQKQENFKAVSEGIDKLTEMVAVMDAGGPVTISDIQAEALKSEALAGFAPGTSAMSRLVEAKVGGEAISQERKVTSRQFADQTISDSLDVALITSDASDSDDVRIELRAFRKEGLKQNFEEFFEVSGLNRKLAVEEYKKRLRRLINRTRTIEVKQGDDLLGIKDTDVIREVEKLESALKALK